MEIFGTAICSPHAPVKCHVSAFITCSGVCRAGKGPAGSACAWLQQSLVSVPSVCLSRGTGAAARLKTGWVGWSRMSGASSGPGGGQGVPGPAEMSCANAPVLRILVPGRLVWIFMQNG